MKEVRIKSRVIYFNLIILTIFVTSCNEKKEYYKDGQLKAKYTLIDGVKNGKYTEYYPTGEISLQNTYVNGLVDGEYIEYFKSGKIKIKAQAIKGNPLGWWKYYDECGRLDSALEYILIYSNKSYLNNNGLSPYEYDEKNAEQKGGYCNRFIVYDDNEEPIRKKTAFISVKIVNDTLNIGDSVIADIRFYNSTFDQNCVYVVNLRDSFIKSKYSYIESYPTKPSEKQVSVSLIAKKRGLNYFQGVIYEYVNHVSNNINHVYYFKQPYFVR